MNPRCKRCGSSESINHLLFHCPFAREVWRVSPLDGSFEVSGLTDLRADWTDIHQQICLPPTGLTTTPLVPWIMWSLWKARNKYVFENFAGNPADSLSQAIVAAKEWSEAQARKEKRPQGPPHETPPQVTTVVRSDASWLEISKVAGLSWVVTHQGMKTMGQRGTSFTSSALIAEGMALREAVEACRNLGVREAQFESDSRQLINAIISDQPVLEIYGIVEDILRLALEFETIVFVWIPRMRNAEADMYAKQALSLLVREVGEAVLMPPPN